MKAAGIASEGQIPQVFPSQPTCVNCPPPCLRSVCTDEALSELVTNWHRLSLEVRKAILAVAQCALR